MKSCSNLTILSEAETITALASFGLTLETMNQPTRLELLVELEQGRITGSEFTELMKQAR